MPKAISRFINKILKNKILIVGLGSIGKRHLKNILSLGYENVSLVRRNAKILKEFPSLKVYKSISNACETNNFNTVIISTPTSNHFKDFIEASNNNISKIYIEKPICYTLEEAQKIQEVTKQKKIDVVIGYDLHFDLGLQKVQELLSYKVIGKVCFFKVEVGQYLPDWRPNEDYRKGMSAKKDLGGGVMLDLIHEFDYTNWIFGPIIKIFGKNSQISNLEIETEDTSLNIVETKTGILGLISLDYLQKELSRTCKIIGDKGTIIWNYKESKVMWMSHEDTKWKSFRYDFVERNDRFMTIIKTFLEANFNNLDTRLTKVKEATVSLKMVIAAKKSNLDNKFIEI